MDIFNNKYIIVSIIGSHAGVEPPEILQNKKKEIDINGMSYWHVKSSNAPARAPRGLCRGDELRHQALYD